MKVGLAFAAIGLFWACVAAAVYATQVPPRLVDDYEERARPEQLRLRKAMRPVYRTFTVDTFGVDDRPIRKATNERAFVRAIARVSSQELRQLRPARKAVARARRTLAKVDEDALLEVPEAPFVNGRDKLPDARAIADDEGRYLDRSRRFLRDYDRLVAYEIEATEFYRDIGIEVGRGFDKIPNPFTSSGQFTGPVTRVIGVLERGLRRFRKRKPPPDVKREHRINVGDTEFLVARLRDMNAAARGFDNAGLRRAYQRLNRQSKRSEKLTRNSIVRLVAKSRLAKQLREVRKRERELSRAFAEL